MYSVLTWKNYLKKSAACGFAAALIPLSLSLASCRGTDNDGSDDTPIDEIAKNFRNPEGLTDVAVYWYWLNDNISADGVVKDLDAMKSAGITRAYIGFQGIDDIPQGKVPFESEEWWNVLSAALRHAGEIGIDIGIFNSPGWSQSGGPWVTEDQSMKYVAFEKLKAEGDGSEQVMDVPRTPGSLGDIAVIAYKSPDAGKIVETSSVFVMKPGKPLSAEMSLPAGNKARTLKVKVSSPFRTEGSIECLQNGKWIMLKKFPIERYNAELHVGFHPYAPVVVAVPHAEAEKYRVNVADGEGKIEITLGNRPEVEAYAEKSMAKMFQEPLPLWGAYMWDAQTGDDGGLVLKTADFVDLSKNIEEGKRLRWKVPQGQWEIMFLRAKTTGVRNAPAMPDATGLEIDKLDKNRAAEHFDAFIGEILRRIPAEERRTFRYVVSDSYEVGGQNWTEKFFEKFRSRYGYDPLPYMPVLDGVVVDSRDQSDRFLWDYRRLIADLLADEYIGGLREKANSNGLKLWLENYGHWGYTGEFLQYGSRADEVSGEFWSEGNLGDIENRGAASCAHIYGKKIVWSESCTSGVPSFCRYPAIMKQRVDRFFTEGINSTLLHLYIQQQDDRQPGLAAWFGNEFNRNNVWFDQLDIFLQYIKRCNYMLQQGRYVADAAYFIGEDTPKMTGICDPVLPYGYSFDYINAEVLMEKAKVIDGRLVLDSGMEYSVLVLPDQQTMRPELLSKIKQFVEDGLTVTGPRPEKSPSLQDYPEADSRLAADASLLWGDGSEAVKYGKGTVYPYGTSLETIFGNMSIKPDLAVDPGDVSPLFIHRTLPDAEIYFISNPTDSVAVMNLAFRVGNEKYTPQLWDAVSGEQMILSEFRRNEDGTVSLPVRLDRIGSAFIVFSESGNEAAGTFRNIPVEHEVTEIKGPWNVNFEISRRGPASGIVMETLKPLDEVDNDSVRYYSGKTFYKADFTLPEELPDNLYADLGEVMVMGRVRINGKDAGGVWTAPRRVNVTSLVKPGENIIEVETVNNWKNRLILDSSLPEKEKLTWTNQQNYSIGDRLQRSGLIGPVRIISLQRK